MYLCEDRHEIGTGGVTSGQTGSTTHDLMPAQLVVVGGSDPDDGDIGGWFSKVKKEFSRAGRRIKKQASRSAHDFKEDREMYLGMGGALLGAPFGLSGPLASVGGMAAGMSRKAPPTPPLYDPSSFMVPPTPGYEAYLPLMAPHFGDRNAPANWQQSGGGQPISATTAVAAAGIVGAALLLS